jgi:hypothetical protein
MDQELKLYLDGKFADIDRRFAEIDGKFAEQGSKFATKQDLERVETALLTEFHKWASPVDMRARSQTAMLAAIDLEMEVLRDRVQKLENRR